MKVISTHPMDESREAVLRRRILGSGTTSTPKRRNKRPPHALTTQITKYHHWDLNPTALNLPLWGGGTYRGYSVTDTCAIAPPLHVRIPAQSTIDVLPRMHEATVSRKGRGAWADIVIGKNASRLGSTAHGDYRREQSPASGVF